MGPRVRGDDTELVEAPSRDGSRRCSQQIS
jgi:hypothetical protein